MKDWGRVITAMVTPFDRQLRIDYQGAADLGNKLALEGSTSLVIAGTTGESPTLSPEEKDELFRVMKERSTLPVIAGIGTNDTRTTIEAARRAEEYGVDGLLAVVPYYNKPDQKSLYAHFSAVADAVDTPIMIYNVPGRTGVNLEPDTAVALSRHDGIVALKDASGSIEQVARIVREAGPGFFVYTGEDALIIPTLSVGGYGVVSVLSNVAGKETAAMIDAFLQGDIAGASDWHGKLSGLVRALFVASNPVPVKAALSMIGVEVGGVRMPLIDADEAIRDQLRSELTLLGYSCIEKTVVGG